MLNPDAIAAVRKNLKELGEPGAVHLATARRLIEASAWWHGHPQSPTRAPKHAERIRQGPHGWELCFGSNYFLVERAIILNKRAIIEALDQAIASNSPIDGKMLRGRLSTRVRESVADFNHGIYEYYKEGASQRVRRPLRVLGQPTPPDGTTEAIDNASKGYMYFGVQAINVDDFVEAIWQLTGLQAICT
jgi:hypothetical protein